MLHTEGQPIFFFSRNKQAVGADPTKKKTKKKNKQVLGAFCSERPVSFSRPGKFDCRSPGFTVETCRTEIRQGEDGYVGNQLISIPGGLEAA